MRTSDRATRRHHVQRLKRNRKHYWGYPRSSWSSLDFCTLPPAEMSARDLGKVLHTPQLCSCPGCGNSRRHAWFKAERLTLQERRWLIQYSEQLDEIELVHEHKDKT